MVSTAKFPNATTDFNEGFINETRDKLVAVGVPLAVFDPEVYLSVGCPPAQFAKLLRPLKSLEGARKVERVLQIGITNSLFSDISEMKPLQFYQFLKFLRTPGGQAALSQAAHLDRLEKRGSASVSAAEVSWRSLFDAQRSDYKNKVGDVRRHYEQRIAELEHQLRQTRAAMAEALVAAKAEFYPAALYERISDSDLNRGGWNAYIAECERKNMIALPCTDQALAQIVETFGDDVRKRHILDYLEIGDHRQKLGRYIENKVASLEKAGDRQAAMRFRDLLDFVGVQQTK